MKLITKEDVLKTVATRFKYQYYRNHQLTNGNWSDNIIRQLENETNLTEDFVINLIGNESWTRIFCDECKQDVESTIELGYSDDPDLNSVQICFECLNKVNELIKNK